MKFPPIHRSIVRGFAHWVILFVLVLHTRESCIAAETLDARLLVDVARRHHLPMPPKDASVVLAHMEWWTKLDSNSRSRGTPVYSPAFLLDKKADGSIVILRGMNQETLRPIKKGEPLWRPFVSDEPKPRETGYDVDFSHLSSFICAVQLAARGDEDNSRGLSDRLLQIEHWHVDEIERDVTSELKNPELLLGRCIFDHLREQIRREPTKWNETHVRMKSLLDDIFELKTDDRAQLLDDLGLSVQAPARIPATGSIEALMLEWARTPKPVWQHSIFDDDEDDDPKAGAAARDIVVQGYAAIPGLIELLDDRRVSVHERDRFTHAPVHVMRIGDLAKELLESMAVLYEPSSQGDWSSSDFRDWWENTKHQDEADFFAQATIRSEEGTIVGSEEYPARILANKYPTRLPPLLEQVVREANPEVQPFAIAEAIADSRLSKEVRVKVLADAVGHGSLECKRCILQVLSKLEERRCAELLPPVLAQLTGDCEGKYWTCAEASFSHVVMQIEDDEIWRQFLRAARRSSVGLRMEMMGPMNYGYIGEKNRDRRIAFLAAFLDDAALRDDSVDPEKFDGPCAAFTIHQIEVRNFAAMQLASILFFDESPDESWTDDQWQALREKVKAAIKSMKLPQLSN